MFFFKVVHLHCAGFKVACKHSQHLRSAGKTFTSCMLLKPSQAIPTQQAPIKHTESAHIHDPIQMHAAAREEMLQPRLVRLWPLLLGACTQCHLKLLGRLQIRRIYKNHKNAFQNSSCHPVLCNYLCGIMLMYMYIYTYIYICTFIWVLIKIQIWI